MDPAIEAKSLRMIGNIRRFYQLGERANSGNSTLSTADFAVANGVNIYTMRTARRFARRYTKREVNELCSLRRPNGLALHWGHIQSLLPVTAKRGRQQFQRKAAKENWSAQQLQRVLQQKYGLRGHCHGRGMKKPANLSAGLQLLIAEGKLWRRRCVLVMQEVQEAQSNRDLRQLASEAVDVLGEIAKTARVTKSSLKTFATDQKHR